MWVVPCHLTSRPGDSDEHIQFTYRDITTGLEKDGVCEKQHDSVLGLTAEIVLDSSPSPEWFLHFTLNGC